jgi:branched-chain amino acid aminotransferase
MSTKVYLATGDEPGQIVDPAQAAISVFDRGFLYGDSVYETMRTAGGRAVELARHLQRLHHSADQIGLELPVADEALAGAIARTHAASGNAESYVRVMVTRGEGPLMLDSRASDAPTMVIIVQPLKLPEPAAYERGLSAVVVDTVKGGGTLDPSIKSGNYLSNVLALREAIAAGGEDAIMRNPDGDIAEGATSNLFVVVDGRLHTPSLSTGVLAGITRQVVVELATELGMAPQQGRVTTQMLEAASEVFLTSSVRGIMPVTRLDGHPVAQGRVGPVSQKLMDRYAAYLAAYLAGAAAD